MQPRGYVTMPTKRKTDRRFWIVVGTILLLSASAFGYARYRIAREQKRQDLITDQFVYIVDEDTGRKRLVPRHPDWEERIERINSRYGK